MPFETWNNIAGVADDDIESGDRLDLCVILKHTSPYPELVSKQTKQLVTDIGNVVKRTGSDQGRLELRGSVHCAERRH